MYHSIEVKPFQILGVGTKQAIYVDGEMLTAVGKHQVAEALDTLKSGVIDENRGLSKSLQGTLLKMYNTRVSKMQKEKGFSEDNHEVVADQNTIKYEASNLCYEMAKYAIPRIQALIDDKNSGYPEDMTRDEWEECMRSMIAGFQVAVDYNEVSDYEVTTQERHEKVEACLMEFAKHYMDLWS